MQKFDVLAKVKFNDIDEPQTIGFEYYKSHSEPLLKAYDRIKRGINYVISMLCMNKEGYVMKNVESIEVIQPQGIHMC